MQYALPSAYAEQVSTEQHHHSPSGEGPVGGPAGRPSPGHVASRTTRPALVPPHTREGLAFAPGADPGWPRPRLLTGSRRLAEARPQPGRPPPGLWGGRVAGGCGRRDVEQTGRLPTRLERAAPLGVVTR